MILRYDRLPNTAAMLGWLAAGIAAAILGMVLAQSAISNRQLVTVFVLIDGLLCFFIYPFGIVQLAFLSVAIGDSQTQVFQAVGIVLAGRRLADALIGGRPLRIALTPGSVLAVCFVLLLAMSLSVADDLGTGFVALRTYVQLLVLLFLVADYASTHTARLHILAAVAAGGLANAALAAYQSQEGLHRAVGLLGNANRFGITQVIVLSVVLPTIVMARGAGRKMALVALMALVAYSVALSQSRGAALAGLVCVGYYSLTLVGGVWRKALAIAGIAIFVLAVVSLGPGVSDHRLAALFGDSVKQDTSIDIRDTYARAGLKMGWDHVWTGVGLNQFNVHIGRYANLQRVHAGGAHNMYIQVFSETGMFGILVFVAMIGATVRRLRSVRNDTSPAHYFASQCIELAVVAWAIGGLFGTVEYLKLPWMILGAAAALSLPARAAHPDGT